MDPALMAALCVGLALVGMSMVHSSRVPSDVPFRYYVNWNAAHLRPRIVLFVAPLLWLPLGALTMRAGWLVVAILGAVIGFLHLFALKIFSRPADRRNRDTSS